MEIWLDVPGYEGEYKISNFGNVKSIERTVVMKNGLSKFVRKRMMKSALSVEGYFRTTLKGKCLFNHRLVAMAFIPNPAKKPQVNHIDGVRTNNNLSNLEWVTHSENERHARKYLNKMAVKGEKHPSSKISDKIRTEIIRLHVEGKRFCDIARQFNLHQDYVIKIVRKSGQFIKRPRVKTFIGDRRKAYYREYQREWQRRKKGKFESSAIKEALGKIVMRKAL